ncbi:S-adenosylmethionine decarboxylase family protein [Flavobacterium croceum]|uniref:S-adenosylmethionine decarboxylase n=1 Tax=Flavobacterium croceum DSM 17960 TaxID=1121886 RepID=A0A2S4N7A8_9FLAO|nr:S-adenosylmethionine decarboxylase [Flavobacterium croceum]POS01233.1 S-adenosylmethionine decarboxylase [Flavobacterium croceum DSM 17960]
MHHNTYSPGLHKLVTLQVNNLEKLTNSLAFINFSNQIIVENGLEKVGEITHNFENNSFTIAFCLKESHICIHTWPEFKQLTLDVYLCNYLQDNSAKVKVITEKFIEYFQAVVLKEFEINR